MQYEHQLIESIYRKPQRIIDKYKFIRNLPNGLGSTMVFLGKDMNNKDIVVKQCIDKNDYKKEKETLQLLNNSIYTPKLVDFCDNSLYLVSEWCGNDLRNINNYYKKQYLPHIKNIVNILYEKYKIHHNDIRWKNLTFKDNKIYLIDWEKSSDENTELNHDNIL